MIIDEADMGSIVRVLADGVLFEVIRGTFRPHPADDVTWFHAMIHDGNEVIDMAWDAAAITGYGVG